MSSKVSPVIIALLCCTFAQAQTEQATTRIELSDGIVLRPRGYCHLEFGQIGRGSLSDLANVNIGTHDYKIHHLWTENGQVALGFDVLYRKNLMMAMSLYTKLYFSYPQFDIAGSRFTKNVRQDVAIDDAFVQYHFGDADAPIFLTQLGYFKFKYNPDVRNLGEYMFRTGTYPIFFNMSFDFPQERLLGLHVQGNLFESLKLDLLLVSATEMPTMAWSVAALANYDIAKLHFINIGAGVDFANLLNVYNNSTFPKFFGMDGVGDPVTPRANNGFFIEGNGDTTFYTFKGTKVMARLSIDPKVFLPWKAFGENDLKLYAEADIIGLKDYPDSGYANSSAQLDLVAPSYDTWWQKMPVAVGFNLPTFKIMDVLNFELEWFGAQYYNDASGVVNYGSNPLPWDWKDKFHLTYAKSEVKWSVYAKRSFFDGHFALTGQIGRDHLRLPCAAYDSESWAELLVTKEDWWWVLKTSWSF